MSMCACACVRVCVCVKRSFLQFLIFRINIFWVTLVLSSLQFSKSILLCSIKRLILLNISMVVVLPSVCLQYKHSAKTCVVCSLFSEFRFFKYRYFTPASSVILLLPSFIISIYPLVTAQKRFHTCKNLH
jgi:hypothetical protein